MSRRRSRRGLASEINVVPYIDVMLVLLVIFMITAPLLTTGVEVDLPEAQAQAVDIDEDSQPLILTVKQDGSLYLNIGSETQKPMTEQQVRQVTQKALRQQPNTPVLVRGDRQSQYEQVVQGMVLLQSAGAQKVGLITDQLSADELPVRP